MNGEKPVMSPPSQLFLARVWKEPRGPGGNAIRVQIRHVLSGETRYFRRWRDVVAFVMQRLEAVDFEPPGENPTD